MPGYGTLGQLDQLDRDLQHWNYEYQNASSGSSRECFAREQMLQIGSRMVAVAQGAIDLDARALEDAANRFYQSYNSSSSGSLRERIYGDVARALYGQLPAAVERDVRQGAYDTRSLVGLADEYYSQYNNASSGTMKELAYQDLARRTYRLAVDTLQWELQGERDFQRAESAGEEFYRMYQNASSGTIKEGAARELSRVAFTRAEEIFAQAVTSMDPRQRFDFVEYYERRYNSASSGSALEQHFARMKSIAASC